MSRSDQYIGLNYNAKNVFNKICNHPNAIKETCKICDQAFNPYPLIGNKITINNKTYKEELQLAPWSSGPMYLTHIAVYNTKSGKLIGYIGSWKEDRHVTGEINYEEGTYFI